MAVILQREFTTNCIFDCWSCSMVLERVCSLISEGILFLFSLTVLAALSRNSFFKNNTTKASETCDYGEALLYDNGS